MLLRKREGRKVFMGKQITFRKDKRALRRVDMIYMAMSV